jgi:hypothetical protein
MVAANTRSRIRVAVRRTLERGNHAEDALGHASHTTTETGVVIDVVYVVATVLFFALMLGYVAACNRLGRSADVERAKEDVR